MGTVITVIVAVGIISDEEVVQAVGGCVEPDAAVSGVLLSSVEGTQRPIRPSDTDAIRGT